MKKDIPFRPATGVQVAIVPDDNSAAAAGPTGWQVYLLNDNDQPLHDVIVSSSGYGTAADGEPVRTSTLRHGLPEVPAHAAAPVEAIDPAVFALHNQYWVSYYIAGEVFDKKFTFAPGTIGPDQLTPINLLGQPGVLSA